MGVQIQGDTGNVIATKGTFSGDVGIAGTLTYEDVTNIDSVGLVTARNGIEIGARPGVAASISVDGNMIVSGISTVGELISSYGTFVRNVNDNGLTIAGGNASNSGANVTVYGGSHGTYPDTVRFRIDGSEKARIDGSGRLLLGTTTEGYASADDLTIATSGATGITIRSGTASGGTIAYSDGTSGDAEYRGYLQYDHNVDGLKIGTAGAEKLRITASGRLGVGIVSPTKLLDIATSASSDGIRIRSTGNTYNDLTFDANRTSANTHIGRIISNWNGTTVSYISMDAGSDTTNKDDGMIRFWTANGSGNYERLRITSSGKVGINNNNPDDTLDVDGTAQITSNVYLGADIYMYGNSYSGKGIFLGGSGSSNKLDDYEKGNWTPTIVQGGWNIHTNYYSKYVKIGNFVHVQFYIGVNGSGTGSALILGGLPFNNESNAYSVGNIDFGQGGVKGQYMRIESSSDDLYFFYPSENTSSSRVGLAANQIGASYIIGSIGYYAA